ncbi:hypothetical protein HG531_003072 [Fusarium graminearum]|nr:hypothetical protein HG531_003072 [Fusarium graminearum]
MERLVFYYFTSAVTLLVFALLLLVSEGGELLEASKVVESGVRRSEEDIPSGHTERLGRSFAVAERSMAGLLEKSMVRELEFRVDKGLELVVTESLLHLILPLVVLPCVVKELDPLFISKILACVASCPLDLAQLLLGFVKLELLETGLLLSSLLLLGFFALAFELTLTLAPSLLLSPD